MSLPEAPSVRERSPADFATGARDLFRYINASEWTDYRAIMGIFAGTFFSEFTPEAIAARLAQADHALEVELVGDRLEALRRWGNLTVSSAVGNPQSIQDYYRRRNRYLITRAGQEVHQMVEGILTRVDAVTDVSTSRLRALLDALDRIGSLDIEHTEADMLADAVSAVFDPHEAFTAEITQLFAAINQWQSRYDLAPEELRFFAEVLVGYVGERLEEIERAARPIGYRLASLQDRLTLLVERASKGLGRRRRWGRPLRQCYRASSRRLAASGLGASGLMVSARIRAALAHRDAYARGGCRSAYLDAESHAPVAGRCGLGVPSGRLPAPRAVLCAISRGSAAARRGGLRPLTEQPLRHACSRRRRSRANRDFVVERAARRGRRLPQGAR
jgi:hypothetical protein